MFRMWVKVWNENHLVKDMVYENDKNIRRTEKVLDGLREACEKWDMTSPIWLDVNIKDFKRHSRCRFNKDSFVEAIEFEYLELQVIEED